MGSIGDHFIHVHVALGAAAGLPDRQGKFVVVLRGDDFDSVREFLPRLRYAHAAANLGSVETIVGPPATTSHVECTPAERAALGIPEGLVRYSAGIEDIDDLVADLDRAFAAM